MATEGLDARTTRLIAWMNAYGDRLLRLAYCYLKDRHAAEDVAQEVYLKAYRAMGEFRGDSQVYTWLYRITVNLCRDRKRSSWSKQVDLPGELPERSGGESPEDAAIRSDQSRRIWRHVMGLPELYRDVIVLRYYQDLSVAEIATILDMPENTVKTRLQRGRHHMKEALAREEEGA